MLRLPRRRPSPALLVAFAALVVSLSGVAIGAIPARDGDVHACYDRSTGAIELVDTQADRFRCPRNWRGLTLDTSPTQLVSPNGDYRAKVSDTAATVSGPGGKVEVTATKIAIAGTGGIDISAPGSVDIRGAVVTISDSRGTRRAARRR